MLVVDSDVEEILDVVLLGGVFVDKLHSVPDRTVNLLAAVKTGAPGTVLDVGLLSVPSLSEFVLELGEVGNLAELKAAAVFDGEVALQALLSLLGGDDDHTVCCAGSVEGGSGRTLEDCEAFDVFSGETAHAADDDAVDDVQRLVAAGDGAVTADDDVGRCARVGVGGGNLQTGHLTGECVGNVGGMDRCDVVVLHRGGRVAEGLLGAGDAQGGDDRLVKGEGIVFHGHVHGLAGNRDFLRLHTDHVEGKRLSGPGADGELTVGAGGDTESSAFYSNGNARHRLTF